MHSIFNYSLKHLNIFHENCDEKKKVKKIVILYINYNYTLIPSIFLSKMPKLLFFSPKKIFLRKLLNSSQFHFFIKKRKKMLFLFNIF